MKPETKNTLIKELGKMKAVQNKSNYTIAWYILAISLLSLVLFLAPLDRFVSGSKWSMLSTIMILLCLLTILLQSLFVIISYTVDKRLKILFEVFLEKEGEQ
jgi:hypothetical protein